MRCVKFFSRAAAILLLAGMVLPIPAGALTIAVIGTGQVGSALGPEFAALGHTVIYGSREPQRNDVEALVARTGPEASATSPDAAAAAADIVVLAVPGMLVAQITRSLGDLSDKIIIDPTNALRRGNGGRLEMGVATSNAEIIQDVAPDAHVVKAFNTLNWRQMVDPHTSGGPISIPIVGNSAQAKAVVAELIEGLDLEPIDLGPLDNARYVEGMLILWINNRGGDREAFEYHLRKVGPDR